MSSNTKDPLEKQDSSTESDESHSEKELEKAEGNLEHLKIEAAKDDSDDSKAVDSPNQEGTSSSSGDLFNKIFAEQRGLQKPQLERPRGSSDPDFKAASSTDPSKEKELEAKDIDENIGAEMVEEDSHKTSKHDIEPTIYENYPPRPEEEEPHLNKKEVGPTAYENFPVRMEEGDPNTAGSTPPFCQSSTGVTPTSMLQEISPVTESDRPRGDVNFDIPPRVIAAPFMRRSPCKKASSKSFDNSNDSERTSNDVSEIHSEIVDISAEGSVYHDAPENIERKESPSYASAVEVQSPDNSDTDISDIQDYFAPPPSLASSSVSASNPSEMPEWKYSMESEPISGDQDMQVCDKPFEQEWQSGENREETNVPEDARKRTSASRLLVQKSFQVCDVEEGSPSKRRSYTPSYTSSVERQSPDNSDTDISEIKECLAPPPSVASSSVSASNPSEMPESMESEPISGDQRMQVCDKQFEQERHSGENREETNVPEDARKRTSANRLLVQKSVQVCDVEEGSPSKRRRSSKDVSRSSTEEKGTTDGMRSKLKQDAEKGYKMAASKPSSALQSTSEYPEQKSSSSDELHLMEFPESKSLGEAQAASNVEKGPQPTIQQSTVLSKPAEKELMVSKPSTSSNQAYGSKAQGTLMEHEQSIDDFGYEGSVESSEREPKLGKKGRLDKMPTRRTRHDSGDPDMPTCRTRHDSGDPDMPTRRTRHDSGDPDMPRVSHGHLQHSESTSPPDVSVSTISPSEEETKL